MSAIPETDEQRRARLKAREHYKMLAAAAWRAVLEITEKLECDRCKGTGDAEPASVLGRGTCPSCQGSGHPDPKQVAEGLPAFVDAVATWFGSDIEARELLRRTRARNPVSGLSAEELMSGAGMKLAESLLADVKRLTEERDLLLEAFRAADVAMRAPTSIAAAADFAIKRSNYMRWRNAQERATT
jgi:hypothetical protein